MKTPFVLLLAALLGLHDPPTVAATTIFDNTTGLFNGATRWLAGRFCVGPQPDTLDSVALPLNSGNLNRPHVSTVRLQHYSQTNNRPAASTRSEVEKPTTAHFLVL